MGNTAATASDEEQPPPLSDEALCGRYERGGSGVHNGTTMRGRKTVVPL